MPTVGGGESLTLSGRTADGECGAVVDDCEIGSMTEQPEAMTWYERELVTALKRLADAQARLAALTEQAETSAAVSVDLADVERLRAIEADVAELEGKAKSRFGGSGARDKMAELQMQERLILERIGCADLAEACAAATSTPVEAVDATMLEFATRELADAKKNWLELQAMEIPDVVDEPDAEPDDAELAEVTNIDHRARPQAAS